MAQGITTKTSKLILDAMPGTMREISAKSGLDLGTIRRYMRALYPAQCHKCGHKSNTEGTNSNPAAIYAKGVAEDTPLVKVDQTKMWRERTKERMKAYRAAKKMLVATTTDHDDPNFEKILAKQRKIAEKNVQQALSKQNTPFGPLFELGVQR